MAAARHRLKIDTLGRDDETVIKGRALNGGDGHDLCVTTGAIMVSGPMDDGADRGHRQRARRPDWNSGGPMRRIATVRASAAVKNYGKSVDPPDGDGHGPVVPSPGGAARFKLCIPGDRRSGFQRDSHHDFPVGRWMLAYGSVVRDGRSAPQFLLELVVGL